MGACTASQITERRVFGGSRRERETPRMGRGKQDTDAMDRLTGRKAQRDSNRIGRREQSRGWKKSRSKWKTKSESQLTGPRATQGDWWYWAVVHSSKAVNQGITKIGAVVQRSSTLLRLPLFD